MREGVLMPKKINNQAWLSRLIAFDTTSRNSNLELIHHIQEWLTQHGVQTRLTYDADKVKANLLAVFPAHNGSTTGGLVLSGHTDVVPVDGQQWDTHPLQATERNHRIYGRGACDMKGFLAVLLALTPELQTLKLQKPLYFAFSYDEEVGCTGAPVLIEDMLKQGIKPDACIVGEPSEMRPIIAHKGINAIRCRVNGFATHSSLTPQGCNAIEYAAELICWLRNMAEEFKKTGPFDAFYDVPFTSMSTNLISGGNAVNTIPAFCEFSFEFRNLSNVSPKKVINQVENYITETLLPKMRGEYKNASIELDSIATAPGLETSEKEAIVALARSLTQEHGTHKVAYATEAGLFQQAGVPTIVCGPGNIQQAHRANEFVEIQQLEKCETFIRQIVQTYLADST
jgi:acetylornithine deacetylase